MSEKISTLTDATITQEPTQWLIRWGPFSAGPYRATKIIIVSRGDGIFFPVVIVNCLRKKQQINTDSISQQKYRINVQFEFTQRTYNVFLQITVPDVDRNVAGSLAVLIDINFTGGEIECSVEIMPC